MSRVVLSATFDDRSAKLEGQRVRFSAYRCLEPRDEAARRCLAAIGEFLLEQPNLACFAGPLLARVLEETPGLRGHLRAVVSDPRIGPAPAGCQTGGPEQIPPEVQTVFLAATRSRTRARMRQWLPALPERRIIDADVLMAIASDLIPARAWIGKARDSIYPIEIPEIEFQSGLDLLLVDCPARNLGLMPNGLGYVHNALRDYDLRTQTCDLDIILYHRFHEFRLLDAGEQIRLASGRVLPADPWQAEHYDLWEDESLVDYFQAEMNEIIEKIVAARPKVLGLSIHACNEKFSQRVVRGVKSHCPDMVILVGGFSCYNADIGLRAFPDADIMCVGEADLTVADLVDRLAKGERPANVPGVLSRWDRPEVPFVPGPMPHNLDRLDFPTYDWFSLDLYRNHNGYQLTPILASRGCRWSRCTFCAERFYWRIRSPENFVDELEWLVGQGCHLFMFNESDLNGMPDRLLEICEEIRSRQLKVRLTGQLRIHKEGTRAYYDALRAAGFVALRFGVDAFSSHALRLQKKGYTIETVRQNLKDCWEAGIYTEINWVIGVPGETEEDIDEAIENILSLKEHIGRLANINPLILTNGSVYWLEPEAHGIEFREPRETLLVKYPRAIPAHLWYSRDPYIDEKVRKRWFERIVCRLADGGFPLGPWAEKIVEVVRANRDRERCGAAEPASEMGERGTGEGVLARSLEATCDASQDALAGREAFRAGTPLGEAPPLAPEKEIYLLADGEEHYAVPRETVEASLGPLDSGRFAHASVVPLPDARVDYAFTKAATPELVFAVGDVNIVQFDGRVYGIPQSLGKVELRRSDPSKVPGVIVARNVQECRQIVEKRLGLGLTTRPKPVRRSTLLPVIEAVHAPGVRSPSSGPAKPSSSSRPIVHSSHRGYSIVEYEGWFHAVPERLGDVDFAQGDVVEHPDILRDVSPEVVVHEIDGLLDSAETEAKCAGTASGQPHPNADFDRAGGNE